MGGAQSPDPSGGFTLPLTLAPHCPHLVLATPAGSHLLAMPSAGVPLSFIHLLLPTEYEQQPAPVPSMEKKRTVYQMALSKMSQHGSLMPNPSSQPLRMLHAFGPSSLGVPQTPGS